MKIASFNVNGIRARLDRLREWLDMAQPDIVCLQETKCADDVFPADDLEKAGYHSLIHGQKGRNGVAILSRLPAQNARLGLDGDDDDAQCRYLEADIADLRIACLYLPYGNPMPGPHFDYKLRWMDRLEKRAAALFALEKPVILAGDYNVIPSDADVWSPAAMADNSLMHPQVRAAFHRLINQGWTDAVPLSLPPGAASYSFWDYRGAAWDYGRGFRIDHLLLSPEAADHFIEAGVDQDVRGRESASDHAPVWVNLASECA